MTQEISAITFKWKKIKLFYNLCAQMRNCSCFELCLTPIKGIGNYNPLFVMNNNL